MAVQLKHNYHHLPLTITPILCQPVLKPAPVPPKPEAPDLTFHCMCCSEYFVHPLALYQHMNSRHPNEPAQEQKPGESQEQQVEEGEDYSWIFEPVCELEEQEQQSQPASDDSDSSDEDDSDDDDSSDDDDDDSSSSSSSSNSSSSTSSMPSSTSNSTTQQSQSQSQEPMDSLSKGVGVSFGELESAHPMRCLLAGPHPNEFHLQMADSRESTSIILLQPSMSITPLSTPVSQPHPPPPPLPPMSISLEPAPIKRRRGRRSKANNPMLDSALAANPAAQKCFQCSHCEASFPNAGDLSKHVRSHITNKPFQCSICQKTFTHIGSLNTHIRIHSGEKPYKCEICPKAFTQSSSLMVHMRSHAVRKPHQCVQCDKGFVNYTSLLLHQKTHTAPTETFACPECEREFKAEALLDEHMRMHTQELVYQCAICREAFRVSSELVQHMKNHMGEKPFTCSLCDRSFTQSGSLNIHMRIHTGEKPFQCKLCEKCFTQASSLSVHMKIHAGEKPFPCHICGKSYSQQAYLNKHIQSHNRADSVPGVTPTPVPMQRHETLVCIVCGSLHADATALALHVTSQHAALLDNIKHTAMPTPAPLDGKCSLIQQQAYMQRVQSMLQQMSQQQQQLPAMDSTGEDEEDPEEEEDLEEEEEESLPEADDCEPSVSASEQETVMDSDMYYEEFADMDVGCQEEVCGDYVDNEEEVCTEEFI
ncbi:zinc finger protein 34 [Drosophila persimilis]|uniref:zinc finger protein 34 n=1 Tax=Drosophila persimilis TaxID=7234 RepID=UPI000F08AE6F|nr:zinc finger protein 34 [Drosophila persimilis]